MTARSGTPADDPAGLAGWRALAEKYEALHALRVRRDEEGPHPPREELRRWSQAFPGCLRELDRLSAEELATRAATLRALLAAAASGKTSPAPPPWLAWIVRYHALLREELEKARPPSKRRSPHEPATPAASSEATTSGSLPSGPGVRALRTLAREIGVEERIVAEVLFPPRRSRAL